MTPNEKADSIIEFLRNNKPKVVPFKVEAGICTNYEKNLEATIASLKNYEYPSIYWKAAYIQLYNLKKIIENEL